MQGLKDLPLLTPTEAEWTYAWESLGVHPVNRGLQGEARFTDWQYLSSFEARTSTTAAPRAYHSFRNRHHVLTRRREQVYIPASAGWPT